MSARTSPKRAPRYAIVERDLVTGDHAVILFHDSQPLVRMVSNCDYRDTVAVAAIINDTIQAVEIIRK